VATGRKGMKQLQKTEQRLKRCDNQDETTILEKQKNNHQQAC
jgi:hypothetical protein